MGIPVIAIGVPTVVDAVSITSDTIDFILKHFGKELEGRKSAFKGTCTSRNEFRKKRKLTEEDLTRRKAPSNVSWDDWYSRRRGKKKIDL